MSSVLLIIPYAVSAVSAVYIFFLRYEVYSLRKKNESLKKDVEDLSSENTKLVDWLKAYSEGEDAVKDITYSDIINIAKLVREKKL